MNGADTTVEAELEAARADLRAGDVARAVARLEALRARAPAHARVAAGLAQAYLKSARVDAALAVATEAAGRSPGSYHVLVALGQARRAARDLEGAREAFGRARAVSDNPWLACQLGRVLLQLGEAQAALDVVLAARRHGAAADAGAPARPDASLLTLEGDALARLGRHEEAGRAYAAAQELAPEDPFAQRRLLEARLRGLDGEEALGELAALARVPAYAGRAYVHQLLAQRLHRAGRYAEAVAAWTATLALDPDNAFAREQLGFSAWKAGDATRAVEALAPSVRAGPSKQVRTTVTAAYRRLGRLDDLRALLDEAIAANPRDYALKAERRRLGAAGEPEPPRPPPARAKRPEPGRRAARAAEREPELPGLAPPPEPPRRG